MMIGAAAVAVGANAATQPATNTVDGVKWQFRIDTDTRTASLGLNIGNSYANEVAILSSIAGASVRIPSSFAVDGVDYEVTNADNRSFYGLTMKSLIAPETINRWGDYVFRSVTTLQNLYLRGPAVGTIEVTFFINSFKDNTGFKYILIDPTVRPSKTSGLMVPLVRQSLPLEQVETEWIRLLEDRTTGLSIMGLVKNWT